MVKTTISILIACALLFGFSFYELYLVKTNFEKVYAVFDSLYQKIEARNATYEDGTATRAFWESKKQRLHIWLPHTTLQEVDYHLDEAIGYLHDDDYPNAIAQLEVIREIAKEIPISYTLSPRNIF